MNPKEKDNEIIELTDEELDEVFADDDFDNSEEVADIRSFYFSNPDPYAKVKPRPDFCRRLATTLQGIVCRCWVIRYRENPRAN